VGFVAETVWVRAENAGLAVTARPAPQAEACGYPEVAGVAFGLQRSTGLRAVDSRKRTRVGGTLALSSYYSNASPVGGNERDWLVTIQRPDGLLFFICTAPENDFSSYDAAFQAVISSVGFRQ